MVLFDEGYDDGSGRRKYRERGVGRWWRRVKGRYGRKKLKVWMFWDVIVVVEEEVIGGGGGGEEVRSLD